jgi:hypothetical protein
MSVQLNLANPSNPFPRGISTAMSFSQVIAFLQAQLYQDFLFGTAASGSSPIIPIRNLTDLAVYFNPQADVSGTAVQNEEIERFLPFNTNNHVFNSNDLTLTAVLETGSADVVPLTLQGAVSNTNVLTFTSTTGVVDSMMCAFADGLGTPSTGIRVTAHDATTVTLSSNVTLPDQCRCEFLPFFVVPGVSAGTSTSILTFPSVPAAVQNGMMYTNITNGTFAARRVTGTTPTTVGLDGTVSPSAGNLIWFQPPITSGQIWSKDGFQPGKTVINGKTVSSVCMEFTVTLPQSAAGQNGAARGGWPAIWIYSRSSEGFSFDASELDLIELFLSLTAGSNGYTGNVHGGLYNATDYQASVGSGNNHWNSSGFYTTTDLGGSQHKIQMAWTPDMVYSYLDGRLVKSTKFIWSSQCTGQWSCDLAMGSAINAFLTIFFYPRATSQFPVRFVINEVKIYTGF